jgi:hypothetical protein
MSNGMIEPIDVIYRFNSSSQSAAGWLLPAALLQPWQISATS